MHVATIAGDGNGNKKWKIAFFFCFLALVVDGADVMMLSLSLSKITADFGLTSVQAGMLGTVTLLGMGIGGIFGGWASDRFGRVKAISASVLFFSILTGLLSFTTSIYEFAALRFLSGLGLGTVYIVCAGLIAEYVPTKRRSIIVAALQTGWTFGYILASFMAGAIIPEHGWRMLFLLSSSAIILAVLIYIFVPESESWKQEQAAAKLNNGQSSRKASSFKLVFQDKAVLKILGLWMLASALLHIGYNGVNHWMPHYIEHEMGLDFKSMTYYMVGSYTAMILGKLSAGVLADKIGRRFSFIFGSVATAICLFLIVNFHTPQNIMYFLVAFGFLYGMPFGVYSTYMSESFATNIRGTALGTAHNGGRIGSAIAPLLVGYVASGGSMSAGFVILGLSYLVCIIPLFFVREKMYDPQAKDQTINNDEALKYAQVQTESKTT
ncbi:Cis,cis-muconate transport protein [Acinetobacter pragensis]